MEVEIFCILHRFVYIDGGVCLEIHTFIDTNNKYVYFFLQKKKLDAKYKLYL